MIKKGAKMSDNKLSGLIIPMKVLAYNFLKDTNVPSLNPSYSGTVQKRIVKEPEAFNRHTTLKKGIHLHFILPSIMRHGTEEDEKGNKTIKYPYVPDKYIVTRMHVNDNGKIVHDCNIVDSSFYSKSNSNSCITIPFWEESKGTKTRSFRYLGRQYKGIIKENNDYKGPSAPNDKEGHIEDLSSVGPGDPIFNAYYPSCRSVFGYFDDLKDFEDYEPQDVPDLTYSVIGYYSNAKHDLFYGVDSIEKMKKKLEALNLSVSEENFKVCNSCLLFGEVCNIKISKSVPPPFENINIGVGRTSAEALSAVISQEKNTSIEQLLTIIQYNIADETSQIDGNFNIDDTIHSHGFTTIDPIETKPEITIPKEIALDDITKFSEDYSKLCREQKNLGKKQRELQYNKNTLYYLWESYYNNYRNQQKPPTSYLEIIRSTIKYIKKLRATIKIKKSKIEEYKDNINGVLKKIRAKITDTHQQESLKIEEVSVKPFYFPKDPVLMLFGKGIKRTFIFEDDGNKKLPCLTKPFFTDNDEIIGQLAKTTFISEIQDYCKEQYTTFCAMTKKLMQDAKSDNVSDKYPLVMLNKDPYEETILFMSWKTDFYKDYTDISQTSSSFEYGDTDYHCIKDKLPSNLFTGDKYKRECSGKSVLTPHGVCNLKKQLTKYFNNHQKDLDKNTLKEIIENLEQNIPTISQNLGGFTIDLSGLQNSFQMPLNDIIENENATTKGITADVYNCLYNEKNDSFNEVDPERRSIGSEVADLFPLREGFLKLEQLRIVSTFGIIVDVIKDQNSYKGKKYFSENLSPVNLKKAQCFLPLALTTPARLSSYFVSAANKAVPSSSLPGSSPILAIIMPDMLNRNLDIFDNTGELIGILKTTYITKKDDKTEHKVATCTFMKSPSYGKSIENTPIKSFIDLLRYDSKYPEKTCSNDSSYFAELMDVISLKLDNTIPMDQNDFIFGRALVLAEMNIELEYFGGTEFSKKIDDIKNIKKLKDLTDLGLSERNFPVMIGDINRVTDGVICGFYGGDNGFGNGFATFGYKEYKQEVLKDNHPNQFLNAAHPLVSRKSSAKFTLLLDPSLKVTLSTGFLPVEHVQINARHTDFSGMNLKLAEMNTLISGDKQIPSPNFTKGGKYTRIYPKQDNTYHSLEVINDDLTIDIIDKTIITDGFIVKETEPQFKK